MDTTEQENIVLEKKNPENNKKIIEKDELAINKQKAAENHQLSIEEFENSERLTPIYPTIREDVPETEMNELRKSLEDGNSEEIILPALGHHVITFAKKNNDVITGGNKHDILPIEKVTTLAETEDSLTPVGRNDNVTSAGNEDNIIPIENEDNVTTSAEIEDSLTRAERNEDVKSADNEDNLLPIENDDNVMTPVQKEDNLSPAGRDDEVTSAQQDNDGPAAKKRRRRDSTLKKSYVDFLSEEEDFVWDSTSWKETGDDSTSSELDNQRSKRKKLKKRSQEESVGDDGLRIKKINKRKSRKEAKQSGKEYRTKDGSVVREKQLQENPCMEKKCGHNCGNISEEKRRHVFDHYWSLSAEKKKIGWSQCHQKKKLKEKDLKIPRTGQILSNISLMKGKGGVKYARNF